jgi:hypothetical protein
MSDAFWFLDDEVPFKVKLGTNQLKEARGSKN